MLVPFGNFQPDKPIIGNTGLSVAKNCVPVTQESYGPIGALAGYTDALTATCQGGITVQDAEGNYHVFAGDATKLYKLASDGSWDDVTNTGGAYTTGSESRWRFVFMPPNRVVATNFDDNIQTFVIGTSSLFADLSSDAPKAKFIAVVKGALAAFNTWDGTDGYQPGRVWWADFADPTNWPTPGTAAAAAAQSDFTDLYVGGIITGAVGAVGGNDAMIWQENALFRMNYAPGIVFDFKDIERGRGTTIPGSVINMGSLGAFFMADDGPYLTTGGQSVPLGFDEIDHFFRDNLDEAKLYQCSSTIHPRHALWLLGYTTQASGDGLPDRILVYNWQLQRFAYIEQSHEILMPGYTEGYTLEELDQFGTLETLPYSLDSAAWQGGRRQLAGFDNTHKFGFFDGDNLEATLETGEFLDEDGFRQRVDGFKVITDAATYTAAVGYREDLDDAVAYSTATGPAIDKFCKQRVGTRYPRAKVVIAGAQQWTYAKGVIPMATRLGIR